MLCKKNFGLKMIKNIPMPATLFVYVVLFRTDTRPPSNIGVLIFFCERVTLIYWDTSLYGFEELRDALGHDIMIRGYRYAAPKNSTPPAMGDCCMHVVGTNFPAGMLVVNV
jgi:hypothetical protein